MTREEAINLLDLQLHGTPKQIEQHGSYEHATAIRMAIEALKAEPCEDAISREQAIKQCGFGMTSLLVADYLRRLPPVAPKQRMGKWIITYPRGEHEPIYECPYCHVSNSSVFKKYCPNCGAKMGESEDKNDKRGNT